MSMLRDRYRTKTASAEICAEICAAICAVMALISQASVSVQAQSLDGPNHALNPALSQKFVPPVKTPAFGVHANRAFTVQDRVKDMFDRQVEPVLLGFNEPLDAFQLNGEYDVSRLTFDYDPKRSGTRADLVLAFKNAVSVMPEASYLLIEVNGQSVGKMTINAPQGSVPQSFALPANLLRKGTNVVEIKAHQRHRVDCSFDASYELWTKIDPSLSGIKPQHATALSDFASLKTIKRSDHGLTDITLVVPQLDGTFDTVNDALNDALAFVQTIALALGRDDISVSLSDRPGFGPGIDLYVSTADAGRTSSNGLDIRPAGSGDRASVYLNAATRNLLVAQLLSVVQGPLKPFIDARIAGDAHGVINAREGKTYQLSDAGFKSTSFSGRLFRTDFQLNLPSDFYPADYATLDIGLNAATSPGLNIQSQLLVRVNGSIVKSLPMRDTDGQVFDNRRIQLPLRAFRAGKNQVEILAEVGRASDHACLYQERDETTPRFILLENTQIRIPKLARVSRLPELSTFVQKAYPYADGERLDIHVLQSDRMTLSAALTLLTKMSLAANAPLNARILKGAPDHENATHKLVIAPQKSQQTMLSNLEHATNWDINGTAADYLFKNPDMLTTASTPMRVKSPVVEASPDDLLAHFRQATKRDVKDLSLWGQLRLHYENGVHQLSSWLSYQPYIDQIITSGSSGRQARLTQSLNHNTGTIETWLSATNPVDAMDAANILARPGMWNKVHGADILVNLDGESLVFSHENIAQSYRFTDVSLGNLRRILAAWFSDNFLAYVGLVLSMLAAFAYGAARIIPNLGVRTIK